MDGIYTGRRKRRKWQEVVLISSLCIAFFPACHRTSKMLNDRSSPPHSPHSISNPFDENTPGMRTDGAIGLSDPAYRSAVTRLLSAAPAGSSFKVEIWSDQEVYEIGDEMTLFYRANQDAYITLIDVGTGGRMQVILPNRFSRDHLITAGRIYTIPAENADFTIYAKGPAGIEQIKIIATEAPFSIGNEPSEPDIRTAEEIALITRSLEKERWAQGIAEIEIVPKGSKEKGSGRSREIKPKPPEKPVDIIGVPGVKRERSPDQERGVSAIPVPQNENESEVGHPGNVKP
jgi:hypothetical protein